MHKKSEFTTNRRPGILNEISMSFIILIIKFQSNVSKCGKCFRLSNQLFLQGGKLKCDSFDCDGSLKLQVFISDIRSREEARTVNY
jgi:hypothetical protein